MKLYCNGLSASADDLAGALTNYGHFTSLQVRDGAVQGLDLHLQRLQQGTQELFATALDTHQVQAWMWHALHAANVRDASLRVTVYSHCFDFRQPLQAVPVDVLIAVAAPVTLPAASRSLRTVRYQRDLPHLKHVGTFPLFEHRRAALQAGADDALFVGDGGVISEGTTWNIGLAAGDTLVWPQAPALRGTQERLLQAGWDGDQQVRPVTLEALAGFTGAFACNSVGVWPISRIDALALPDSEALCARARAVLAAVPWQPLAG
ncbi:aminotransferase class IV family protein [Stenotrophomonas sp. GZD-301]|uniref:aminotransferase class IV family protein n=1 Tax=Stenotrophomonas sp. GZD-301 TaxID=3404814 RepID=UPI003BB56A5A